MPCCRVRDQFAGCAAAGGADRGWHPPQIDTASCGLAYGCPRSASFADQQRCQPFHRRGGLRSAGGDGLPGVTPRRRILHHGATCRFDGGRRFAAQVRHNEELVWLIRRLLEGSEQQYVPADRGCRTLARRGQHPPDLNVLARSNGAYLLDMAIPFGYLPLREHLARAARRDRRYGAGFADRADPRYQPGARAVIRHLLMRGDTCWSTTRATTTCSATCGSAASSCCPVPRLPDGPDMDALERSGGSASAEAVLHAVGDAKPDRQHHGPHVGFGCCKRRALRFLRRRGRHLLRSAGEADAEAGDARSAAPGDLCAQLLEDAVGQLRVGFVACAQEIANALVDVKMLTSITSSQFAERLIYCMLADGHYRKYVARLQQRMARRG